MEGPLTIVDAMPLLRSGELTPSLLLEQCLARMDVYEPHVKAWVYVDRERARKDAASLTDELKSGKDRGPLHGIPIGVKDIVDVFDMPTGCGSKLWANSYARKDAEVVARLRQAGALILGKTVTTPYAYLDPSETRNPWNLERTPGGSSSGSAAAVACGMCLAALSTQTGGSTVRPASYCGVCSLKFRYGFDLAGVLPLAPSLDHLGIMAHSIRDLEILNNCLDPLFDDEEDLLPPNISDTVLGIFHDFQPTPLETEMSTSFSAFCDRAVVEGWKLASHALPDSLVDHQQSQRQIYSFEAARYHQERLTRRREDYLPRITELVESGLQISHENYDSLLEELEQCRFEVNEWLFAQGCAFVMPAVSGPAPVAISTGDPAWQSPWAYAGVPALSLPLSRTNGEMPIAMQVIGNQYSTHRLLLLSARLEAMVSRMIHLPPVPR